MERLKPDFFFQFFSEVAEFTEFPESKVVLQLVRQLRTFSCLL